MNLSSTFKRAAVALASVATLTGAAQTAQAATPPATIAAHDIEANGLRLHYLQAGQQADRASSDATAIVLLHGYTETSHMWRPLMTRLAANGTVIAPDLPGAGDSAIPANGYDKKALAQDIHAMVHALGYRKVKLVGHDIGLMVAYAYAAQYPDEVQSIVLMDAFLPGVGDWQQVFLLRDKWHFNFYGPTPLALVHGRERVYFEHFWNDFAAAPNHSLSEADREYYSAAYTRPGRMQAGFEYFHAFGQDATDFAAFAQTPLTMPMLVVAGEKASGTFLVDQAKLVDTHVQAVVVPGAGHWLMEEAPAPTMSAIASFIEAPQALSARQ
ncbi:alpha/beta fold hydrolase [Paraburkholderia bannensis]|uniref:alpha/beta fold hydrolase n=1 Tax=Paraburkholderia bannensis TaxID=765414 RepID=UPI002AB60965|nr:alpha/beta hydrolase [Paraburkholderia bannensis]